MRFLKVKVKYLLLLQICYDLLAKGNKPTQDEHMNELFGHNVNATTKSFDNTGFSFFDHNNSADEDDTAENGNMGKYICFSSTLAL